MPKASCDRCRNITKRAKGLLLVCCHESLEEVKMNEVGPVKQAVAVRGHACGKRAETTHRSRGACKRSQVGVCVHSRTRQSF